MDFTDINTLLLPPEKDCIIVCMIVQGLSFLWLLGCQNILMSKHISGWNLGFFLLILQHIEGVLDSPQGPVYCTIQFLEFHRFSSTVSI